MSLADYDFDVAKYMYKGRHWLYVGFMCHQAIEKALKAVIAKNLPADEIPPKIHDLAKLASRSNLFIGLTDKQKHFIEELNPLNIESRYPEYKRNIALLLTKEKCKQLIKETGEFLSWIKTKLEK